MKSLLLTLISFFILVGCAQKPVVISKAPEIIKKKEKKTKVIKEQVLLEVPDIEEKEEPLIEEETIKKIAVLYPSKIVGKYAKSTLNTISAYLLFNNKPFEVETFDTYDESLENITSTLNRLNEKSYTKVIALFTQNGFNIINSLDETQNLKIYFSLINKSEIFTENENFIFGGISYEKQMQLLQTLSSERNTMFYVNSYLGNKLRDSYLSTFGQGIIKEIDRKNNRYRDIMKDERMIGSTVLLNTPMIKSSIIMSQFTAYEISPFKILSTQLNYSPLLLKLTQKRDRENFFVVSSISNVDPSLVDYAKMLGADITYNWVDYSSLVGIDFLLNHNNEANENGETRLIKTEIIDGQVEYEKTLYRSTSYGFQEVLTN